MHFLTCWNFQLLSQSEKRQLKLGTLLGDTKDIKELKKYNRKWDSVDESKKKIILLSKVLEANNLLKDQHLTLSPKEYILAKLNHYELIDDDFKLIEDMSIKELL